MMAVMYSTKFILFLLVVSLCLCRPARSSLPPDIITDVEQDPGTQAPAKKYPSCAYPMTCMECVLATCHWSIERQVCQRLPDGTLTVGSTKGCPVLVAVYDGHTFRVRVSNDVVGILGYVAEAKVSCWRGPTGPFSGHVVTGKNWTGEIVCDRQPMSPAVSRSTVVVGSYYITFGPDEFMLHTDDRAQFYESILYDRDCGRHKWAKYCMACISNGMYVQQCRAKAPGEKPRCVDWMVGQDDQELNRGCWPEGAGAVLCKRVAATTAISFHPPEAPWDANASLVTINVDGHRSLAASNGLVRVTVAGRECRYPYTLSEHQFNCTVQKTATAVADESGPVVVEYVPDNRTVEFCGPHLTATGAVQVAVRNVRQSAVSFTFGRKGEAPKPCDPRPVPGQTLSGIMSGGTSTLLEWSGIDCVRHPRDGFMWHVEDPDTGTKNYNYCHFLENSTSVCFAPRTLGDATPNDIAKAKLGNVGAIRRFNCRFKLIESATGVVMHIPCSSGGYLSYADPVYEGFDVIDNGTTVVVYGQNIGTPAVRPSDIYVKFPAGGPVQGCTILRITYDWLKCSAPQGHLNNVRDFVINVKKLTIFTAATNEKSGSKVCRFKTTTSTAITTTITTSTVITTTTTTPPK